MTTMERPIDEQPTQDDTPALTPREQNKRDLAEAIVERERWDNRVQTLYRESESLGISVREMAGALNAHPNITVSTFSTWARRRATACGRKQVRKPTHPEDE